MVEVGFVVWVGWLCLAVIGLAIGLYVLRNIVREARERDPTEQTIPERAPDPPAQEAGRRCPNCRAVNDPSFEYCFDCATKL